MFPVSLFLWWYTTGWRDQVELCGARLSRVSDNFSVTLLLRSLFAPFRQISAEGSQGAGLDAAFRAWLDKLISRCIGAIVRSVLIITGLLLMLCEALVAAARLLLWPLLPFLPVLGAVLMLGGWVPVL